VSCFKTLSGAELVEAPVERDSVAANAEAPTVSYNGGFDKLNHRTTVINGFGTASSNYLINKNSTRRFFQ
jgi:hypothetical protein